MEAFRNAPSFNGGTTRQAVQKALDEGAAAKLALEEKRQPELKYVSEWCGRPVTELSREELLEVIEYLGKQLREERASRELDAAVRANFGHRCSPLPHIPYGSVD